MDQEIVRYPTLFLAPDGVPDLLAFGRLRVPGSLSVDPRRLAAAGPSESAPDGGSKIDRGAMKVVEDAGAEPAPDDSAHTKPYWLQRQALRIVRTGRDLIARSAAPDAKGLVALGGIDYERFASGRSGSEEPAFPPPAAASTNQRRPRSDPAAGPKEIKAETAARTDAETTDAALLLAANRRLGTDRGLFDALSNTSPEVRDISGLCPGAQPILLLGTDASEPALRSMPRAPRVLHLATHGFFLPRHNAEGSGVGRALTLSGLALSGANRGLEGKLGPHGEDGILYALEVQDLNLEGTELVTLSACDTGRGAVDLSEGVYGLVRAFQIAGSRHVLMTLWSLNDPLAREFMVDFYRRWLSGDAFRHPAAALRATQLDWIQSADPRKADPRYWAPYVLIERG